MEEKELEEILRRLESIEIKVDSLEKKINSNVGIMPSNLLQNESDSTRSISENLVDNLKLSDVPASNFSKSSDGNIIDFSSFAALNNPKNLVNPEATSEISQQLVSEMADGTLDVNGQEFISDLEVENKHRFGFTNTHLILLISCLSSVVLIVLGIFFIAYY